MTYVNPGVILLLMDNSHRRFTRFAYALLLVTAAVLMGGCGGNDCERLQRAVTSRELSASYEPLREATTFAPDQAVYSAAFVTDMKPGDTVEAALYYDAQKIHQTFYTASEGGSGWVGFRLSNGSRWPEGKYSIQISLQGHACEVIYFVVSD